MESVDVAVIAVTSLAALLGIILAIWSKNRAVQIASALVVVAAFVLGLAKSMSDQRDKQLLRAALSTTVNLSPSIRQRIADEILTRISSFGCYKPREGLYYSTQDRMTIFLWDCTNNQEVALVLNRYEMADLYVNRIPESIAASLGSWRMNYGWIEYILNFFEDPVDTATRKNNIVIDDTIARRNDPSLIKVDFDDRVGVLGSHVVLAVKKAPDVSYFYDDEGVVVTYVDGQQREQLCIRRDELQKLKPDTALNLFSELERRWRRKIAEVRSLKEQRSDDCLRQDHAEQPAGASDTPGK